MACGDQLKLSSDGLRRQGDPIGNPGTYDPPEAVASPAGDVWSLTVTLVEALTQRLPIWDINAQADPVVPTTLPAPLLDSAHHCLRRDPKQRWTIGDIASRLDPASARQQTPRTVERADRPARPRHLIPAALVLLLMLTAAISLKVLHRGPKVQPESGTTTQRTMTTSPEPRQAETITASEKGRGVSNQTSLADPPPTRAPAQPATPARMPVTGASREDVVHRVIPDAPQSSLDTIRGTVRVSIRVNVNPSGDASQVTIDSPGPSRYFARLAQQAAQQWKFAPAPGARDWILRFEFSNMGAKVFAAPAAS
jgi:TonB family protein